MSSWAKGFASGVWDGLGAGSVFGGGRASDGAWFGVEALVGGALGVDGELDDAAEAEEPPSFARRFARIYIAVSESFEL